MPRHTSKEKLKHWEGLTLKQRESGLSVACWCRENKIALQTFLYWRDKLYPKTKFDREAFTELNEPPVSANVGITFEYQGIHINVDRKFDAATLKRCLEVLREIKC